MFLHYHQLALAFGLWLGSADATHWQKITEWKRKKSGTYSASASTCIPISILLVEASAVSVSLGIASAGALLQCLQVLSGLW